MPARTSRPARLDSPRLRTAASLAPVIAVSLWLNLWRLAAHEDGNLYYAAAARSMATSLGNWFFGSYDPGGFVTVDKPPFFLWFGATLTAIFGYSSWTILLPSALAATATVVLLWWVVRRHAGLVAAAAAGLVLALTPISVVVNRLNLPEPILVLALAGAAIALLRSFEPGRWWAWTLLAGVLVGVGFNTKMLVAWIPGPALALATIVAFPDLRRRANIGTVVARGALLGVATMAVSFSWALVVDSVPAGSRPYIGGSTDNTVVDLIFGYNGLDRVDPDDAPAPGQQPPQVTPGPAGARPTPSLGAVLTPVPVPGGQPMQTPNRGRRPLDAGEPGPWRMFGDANGGQIGWLLPFALGGALVSSWHWRRDRVRRAAVMLWLGWVLAFGLTFSFAEGIYHAYYTAAMAPGIAALVGMGLASCVALMRQDWRLVAIPVTLAAITAAVQLDIAGRAPDHYGSLRTVLVLVVTAGAVASVAASFRRRERYLVAGPALMVVGLTLIPAGWSWFEATNPQPNRAVPHVGPRSSGVPGAVQPVPGNAPSPDGYARWLRENNAPGVRWHLATASAANGSPLVAGYGLSVMALGGFSGRDPILAPAEFGDLVARGEVRYVFAPNAAPAGGRRGQPQPQGGAPPMVSGPGAAPILAAVQAVCRLVTDPQLPPPGTRSVYDCDGRADALRAVRERP
jgi:4-amino-4-deoxy-L-arabinose transferase-like glycosyltransferase